MQRTATRRLQRFQSCCLGRCRRLSFWPFCLDHVGECFGPLSFSCHFPSICFTLDCSVHSLSLFQDPRNGGLSRRGLRSTTLCLWGYTERMLTLPFRPFDPDCEMSGTKNVLKLIEYYQDGWLSWFAWEPDMATEPAG